MVDIINPSDLTFITKPTPEQQSEEKRWRDKAHSLHERSKQILERNPNYIAQRRRQYRSGPIDDITERYNISAGTCANGEVRIISGDSYMKRKDAQYRAEGHSDNLLIMRREEHEILFFNSNPPKIGIWQQVPENVMADYLQDKVDIASISNQLIEYFDKGSHISARWPGIHLIEVPSSYDLSNPGVANKVGVEANLDKMVGDLDTFVFDKKLLAQSQSEFERNGFDCKPGRQVEDSTINEAIEF